MPPIAGFFYNLLNIIDAVLVPLVFAIAFLIFVWGVARYFIAGGADEEKRKEGKKFVLWGIIGFVLMFSLWGIVNLLVNTLGFNNQSKPPLPLFGPAGYGQGGFNTGQQVQVGNSSGRSCHALNFWLCPAKEDCVSGTCVNVDGT